MSEEDVIQYLLSTPDFFARHPDVLECLSLPHPINGKVISLLEYQVNLLRKSTAGYRREFERLVEIARENESTMQKSRRLVLAGLTCKSLDDFAVVVDDMVRDDFGVSYHSLMLFHEYTDCSIPWCSLESAQKQLSYVFSKTKSDCGPLPETELSFLFSQNAKNIRSTAILPLLSREDDEPRWYGVLALGASSKTAFDRDKGDLFIQYIADLLSAIMLRLV